MTVSISPVFAVPLAQSRLDGCEAINSRLSKLIVDRESSAQQYQNKCPSLRQQPGVFESTFDFFSWPDPDIRNLKNFIWTELAKVIAELNDYAKEELSRIEIFSHSWFHVTRHGGFTILHTHPMASWSGVYCVTPGDEVQDRPESGILRFHNPHHFSSYFTDAGNARLQAPYHHGTWSIRFSAGQLVLFPSWLQHEVLPFYGLEPRITVAFNCWFKLRS